MTSRPRSFLIILTVLLVASLILTVMAEGAVRLIQYLKHGGGNTTVTALYETDEKTGLRVLVPGARHAGVTINRQGFRGPDIPSAKPGGTLRLAFIGASTTFCAEIGRLEDTWPDLVTMALKAGHPRQSFDYVNGGVPGYTVELSLKSLKFRIKPYSPDVIVIYHATNDFNADVRNLARAMGHFVERTETDSWVSSNSLLWFLLEKRLVVWKRQQRAANKSENHFKFDPRELSKTFERRLTELVRESKRTAALVAIATFAPRLRRSLSPEERLEAAIIDAYYMPHISIDDMIGGYEQYNTVIRRVARENDIVLIEVAGKIPADDAHYNDSFHFRDAGSRKMAALVTAGIAEAVTRLIDGPAKAADAPDAVR